MRKPILVSILAAALAGGAVANSAAADPPPPRYAPRDRHAPPPPPPPSGWNQRQWTYRQDYVYRHHNRYDDHSDAIIAGLLGFALGAAIMGTQAQQADAHDRLNDPDWIAYCARKYRSFDPHTGTYLGLDGLRHYCE